MTKPKNTSVSKKSPIGLIKKREEKEFGNDKIDLGDAIIGCGVVGFFITLFLLFLAFIIAVIIAVFSGK